MSDFNPPSSKRLTRNLTLLRQYFKPSFVGSEMLDLTRPALFVGNHTLYGIMDVPFMIDHIYAKHGVLLRSLGDRGHFNVPLWRSYLTQYGMVLGSPEKCDTLMESGQSILVFPGGAREVMKRRDEKYQLVWKKRVGFVRMAMKHGYDIIPFASLGPDDCYDVLVDAEDIRTNKVGKKILDVTGLGKALRGGDVIPPISRGLGPTLLPRPQRFYFSFGERISTTGLDVNDESFLWDKREEVASSINAQLDMLKQKRVDDRNNWGWLRRKLTSNIDA